MAPAKPTPRNATGQFGSNTPAHTAKPKAKAPARHAAKKPAPRAKAPAKAAPPKTPEEKSKASYKALAELGINENSAEALRMLNADDGDMPGADAINQAGFVEAGLVAKNPDGTFSITPAGKALVRASETGNAEAAGKVIEHSRDRMKEKANKEKHKKKPEPANKWMSELTITKVDQEQRLVEGFASSERIDSQDDIVDAQAMKDALPEYMQYANLREMHQGPDGKPETSAAGTVIKAEVIEGEIEVGGITYKNPLHIICKVVDDAAWEKVKEGVYKGFSIGGKIIKAIRETIDGKSIRRIVKIALYEISLVDRPANQDARILLWKGFEMSDLEKAAGDADLSKPIAGIQAARNAAELAGDLDASNLLTQAIALLLQANGDASADESATEEAPEETPADGPIAAAEGADEATEDDQVLASAQATVRKAGRALNSNNMAAMQSTIKSLLGMLAAAGDPVASKALQLYTPAPQPGVEQKAASPEDMSKAIAAGLEPLFKSVTDTLAGFASEIEAIKRQPRAGGPASRPVAVDKTLPGKAPAEPVVVNKAQAEANLAVLKRFAATDPDPQRRANYAAKAAELEKSLA